MKQTKASSDIRLQVLDQFKMYFSDCTKAVQTDICTDVVGGMTKRKQAMGQIQWTEEND